MYVLIYRAVGAAGVQGGEISGFSTEAAARAAGNKIQDSFTGNAVNVTYVVVQVA